ncbi:5'-adenylylsulfate reductase-like 5 isoform X3 [Cajanus cajan]|uniref:5'-adenylylsulfate reductase-like 5 isoform X3 n=1 Tax=Cajanus cajan TaxID=3821 RepID=UPI00098D9F87|nr:5'-adenylylsulfate reductase-like 5 isoform X3 [Cajanus cajan]
MIFNLSAPSPSPLTLLFSLYTKYGIHSIPAIILVNQTSRVRYHGQNNLNALVQFYERNTGLEARDYVVVGQLSNLMSDEHSTMKGLSLQEILIREPYLTLSIFFLCLRIVLFVFPAIKSGLQAFWTCYVPHLNLNFGQVMERILSVNDVQRIWTKLGQCKTRNFHHRARSIRVWVSSLSSVSLGDSSASYSYKQRGRCNW